MDILTRLLWDEGHEVDLSVQPRKSDLLSRAALSRKLKTVGLDGLAPAAVRLSSSVRRRLWREGYDIALCLEHLPPTMPMHGVQRYFVPNLEWLFSTAAWKLPLMDGILCKTRHALQLVSEFAPEATARYLGFTSMDLSREDVRPDRWQWLHVASRGEQKNTKLVLDTWQDHPEWPHLTVLAGVSDTGLIPRRPVANMTVIHAWLSEEDFTTILCSRGVHVCPSQTEGFGHSIVEAMSCGAVVLTSDVPPMSELVDESRGVLVDVSRTEPLGYGYRGIVERSAFEAAVERAICLTDAVFEERARAARAWYKENDIAFRRRFLSLIEESGNV